MISKINIKKNRHRFSLTGILVKGIFLVSLVLISCSRDDDVDPGSNIPAEIKSINNFIWNNMDYYYLWREFMPTDLNPDHEPDPEEFFDKLLFKVEDKWSFITDDHQALINRFSGINYTFGHNYQLFKEENTDNVFGIIEYVVKNSPADEAGLERGDIFNRVNGIQLTSENYLGLLNGVDSYTLGMAELVDKKAISTDTEISLSAAQFQENPIYKDTILEVQGNRIGYIMYTQFISDFESELGAVLTEFKSQAINELVIDLRYNLGGTVSTSAFFASFIAPAFQVENKAVYLRYIWNDLVEQYWLENQGEDSQNLVKRFPENANNLDLDRIYFLIGKNSASASEALINGLLPYMDVTLIGQTTRGKYTGSVTLHDEEESFNWAIQPIVVKTANANGNTEYKDGFAPDHLVEDDYFSPLGSLEEDMLGKAISLITGIPADQLARKSIDEFGLTELEILDRGGLYLKEDPSYFIIDNVRLE